MVRASSPLSPRLRELLAPLKFLRQHLTPQTGGLEEATLGRVQAAQEIGSLFPKDDQTIWPAQMSLA